MRLVPNTDTVPTSVNKYLLPHERQVITVHRHPAVLIRPIFEVLVGLAIAGWLSSSVAHGNGTALLVIWILWVLLLLRLAVKAYEWSETYFVVTSQRMLLQTGLVTRKVNMMPLSKVTDMSFQRSSLGRILGSVADTMSTPNWARMKACRADDCRWVYLDTAKNHSRAWCSMSSCGNRAKVSAYRSRHTTASS